MTYLPALHPTCLLCKLGAVMFWTDRFRETPATGGRSFFSLASNFWSTDSKTCLGKPVQINTGTAQSFLVSHVVTGLFRALGFRGWNQPPGSSQPSSSGCAFFHTSHNFTQPAGKLHQMQRDVTLGGDNLQDGR